MQCVCRIALWLLVLASPPAAAQHNHAAGHDVYRGWTNVNNQGCCDGRDCGALEEVEERKVNGATHVLVGFGDEPKAWCPVLPHHALKPGAKSPDWSKSHACVVPPSLGGDVCSRLRCYMSRPHI